MIVSIDAEQVRGRDLKVREGSMEHNCSLFQRKMSPLSKSSFISNEFDVSSFEFPSLTSDIVFSSLASSYSLQYEVLDSLDTQ